MIPSELKALKQWVCWAGDKLPKNPHTGGNAMSNNAGTWGTYDEACAARDKYRFDGIGFMFASGYFGVDIDHASDCPEIVDEFVDTLRSYTEVSKSGNGIHIICKGSLPDGARRRGHVEMYQSGRYFIMTGTQYGDEVLPIAECTDQIRLLHTKYLGPATPTVSEAREIQHVDLRDEDVIDKARASASGPAFQLLYQGSWQGAYGSQSEADLAFCNHLAFWTQKDAAQMDRIFRSSGLMRDKWDRRQRDTTYGELTIQKAISGTRDIYDPEIREQAVSVTAGMFKGVKRPPKAYAMTDSGNAERFADMFGDGIRYSHQNRQWLFWDGKRWQDDITGEIKKLVDQCLEAMRREAFEVEDEDEQEARLKWATKSQSSKAKQAMIVESQHLGKIPVVMDDFDRNKDMINCQNGIVNLRNGELIPHDPNYMMSRISFCDYDVTSGRPPVRWLQFLDEITDGDDELAQYLQRAIGYSLTGSIREQAMFFCYGTGQNGKSTFLDIVASVLGTYASHAQPESIMLSSRGGNNALTDIARLKGARFVTTIEPNEGVKLNEGLIKQLTGGDKVTARFLYGREFEFVPEFKLWLGANHKPVVRGTDFGIWRRIHLIPFTVQIPKEKVDRGLLYKLKAELPQIMKWAVDGCIAWQAGGLPLPRRVAAATEEYKTEMDVLGQFFDECVALDYGSRLKAADVYDVYSHWADENHEYKLSATKFGKEMVKRYPERFRTSEAVWYRNAKLTSHAEAMLKQTRFGSFGSSQFTDSRKA